MKNTKTDIINNLLNSNLKFQTSDKLQEWLFNYIFENFAFIEDKFIILFLNNSEHGVSINGGKVFKSHNHLVSYFLQMQGDSKHIAIFKQSGVFKVSFSFLEKGTEFDFIKNGKDITPAISFFRDRVNKVEHASIADIYVSISENIKKVA